MFNFDTIVKVSHVDMKEYYSQLFGTGELPVLNYLDLNSPHPHTNRYAKMKDWCSMIPVICGGLVRRLNLCANQISQKEYDVIS